jgi:drug/metabolite transporter (DMT)-like permease
MLRRLGDRPALSALLGAFCISFSAILFDLARVSATTGAFFRCLWAIPPLLLFAWWEDRRFGPRSRGSRLFALAAGVFLALDLIVWHRAIYEVGAGLSTVLANLQIVMVAPAAWLVLSERPTRRALAAIPIAVGGVVLISGVLEADAYGRNPALGAVYGVITSAAYTGFLLTLRQASHDRRRVAGPVADLTVVCAIVCALSGLAIGDLDLAPGVRAQSWLVLLALSSQVLGWLVIAVSLPRLPAALSSVLLTLQPVLSVLFAAAILSEKPSPLQIGGVVLVLAALLVVTRPVGLSRMRARRVTSPAGETAPGVRAQANGAAIEDN